MLLNDSYFYTAPWLAFLRKPVFAVKYKQDMLDAVREAGREPDRALCRDLLDKYSRYQIDLYEYFYFGMGKRSAAELREYIGNREKTALTQRMNDPASKHIFDNKAETYERFRRFYRRELCLVRAGSEEDKAAFAEFVSRHEAFVVKPIDLYFGLGVRKVEVGGRSAAELYADITRERIYGFVAEELIVQHEATARFHPQSLNTVRFPTIRQEDGVKPWYPFLRMGKGESFVDNISSGGVAALIDPETGELLRAASHYAPDVREHPDTHEPIIGARLPRWDEAVAMVKELAQIVPEMRYVGWDLALSDKGWVLVEGNAAAQMSTQQVLLNRGFRSEFLTELRKMGK